MDRMTAEEWLASLPDLPAGFCTTFSSRMFDLGDVRLHAVIGGEGPPLLLLPGWPQTWFTWRHVMARLARDYTIIAADPRGTGRSDAPEAGYDSDTIAADLARLMTALGHETFAVAGYDIGALFGYALAADYPQRVLRLAIGEATRGFSPPPPMTAPYPVAEKAWHFAFNRAGTISERMVEGREELYFGYQFTSKAAPLPPSDDVIAVYVEPIKASPATLRASF
jgi:pimeloyl-ACP methyl ester carboxylesterase